MGKPHMTLIADGVWVIRGGIPRRMNVYALRDGDGVALFDAGIVQMTQEIRDATRDLGGITRVVLGHSHVDHRGAAPGLGADVFCHPLERADAEGDGGQHYMDPRKLEPPARWVYRYLLPYWDGGPVTISGTVEEGEEVAGFEVVHIPGHAPGQIALWRAQDRLALVSDCFYTVDVRTGFKCKPRVAHEAFTPDVDLARESIRKIARLDPLAAWPGHADPAVGDVRSQLQRAADA